MLRIWQGHVVKMYHANRMGYRGRLGYCLLVSWNQNQLGCSESYSSSIFVVQIFVLTLKKDFFSCLRCSFNVFLQIQAG